MYEVEGSKVVGMVNKSQIVVKFDAFSGRISASSFWWKRKLNKYRPINGIMCHIYIQQGYFKDKHIICNMMESNMLFLCFDL